MPGGKGLRFWGIYIQIRITCDFVHELWKSLRCKLILQQIRGREVFHWFCIGTQPGNNQTCCIYREKGSILRRKVMVNSRLVDVTPPSSWMSWELLDSKWWPRLVRHTYLLSILNLCVGQLPLSTIVQFRDFGWKISGKPKGSFNNHGEWTIHRLHRQVCQRTLEIAGVETVGCYNQYIKCSHAYGIKVQVGWWLGWFGWVKWIGWVVWFLSWVGSLVWLALFSVKVSRIVGVPGTNLVLAKLLDWGESFCSLARTLLVYPTCQRYTPTFNMTKHAQFVSFGLNRNHHFTIKILSHSLSFEERYITFEADYIVVLGLCKAGPTSYKSCYIYIYLNL